MTPPVRAVLRPLPLPAPDDHLRDGAARDVTADLELVLRPRTDVLLPPDDPAERAFYRWVLGHHIAFAVWRLLGDLLERMLRDGATEQDEAEAAAWYDRYSALQVYAGSCTPQVYATVIRQRMIDDHPAFSGVWARDYERVLGLLTRLDPPVDGVLKQALKRHRLVHMTLAKFLVPAGESLLKQAGRRPGEGATDVERNLLDTFFLVRRGPVSAGEFHAEVVHRLAAAQCDLAAVPLGSDELVSVLALLPADLPTTLRDIASILPERLHLEEQDGPRQADRSHSPAGRLRRRAS
ncbi:L-tyrosine 3-hydroxylase [Umezawaea beigongshangensis]|uniref:L-tyrosine 3-hydroxylase n=1 Tax=Umezawaea beigongshangensis TaxID=2780383 RepID=UPI0018F148C8|nr:L-tyrosine 3-hydroxylase [Umezawaea beigongshangensis]